MDVQTFYQIAFGAQPQWVRSASGSVNLLGHYAPFTRGFAMPVTLSPQVYVAYGPRYDNHVVARDVSDPLWVFDIDLANWNPFDGYRPLRWHLASVIHALQTTPEQIRGANIVADWSEVPAPLSMAPANAMTVLLTKLMVHTVHPIFDDTRLAALAHRADTEVREWPNGIIEHLSTVFGQDGHVLLTDWNDYSARPVRADLARHGQCFLIFNLLGVAGQFDGVNEAARLQCDRAQSMLGDHDLREYTGTDPDPVLAMLPTTLHGLVRHVITENSRVWRVAGELSHNGDARILGPELNASHASLRDDYGLLIPEAEVVTAAARAAGAHGARISGGPFGTWVVTIVDIAAIDAIQSAVERAYAAAGHGALDSFRSHSRDGFSLLYPPEDPF